MKTGKCLCGDVEFQIELLEGQVYSCHCSKCQRAHGAAFATQAFADGKTLRFVSGEEQLADYFSGGGYRAFCRRCGSHVMNYAENKAHYLSVAITCLLDASEVVPVANVCIESKQPWLSDMEVLPAHEGIPADL